jgi:signal-transduction protein with cAMP-binding, CBS, and nucleotidyltransferase domain
LTSTGTYNQGDIIDMKIIPDVIQEQTIQSLPSTAKAQDAALLMVERNISAVLIIDDGELSGIVTERDMCRVFAAENQSATDVPLKDIMTVRRHINWNNQRPDLKEDLAHLVDNIKRRICGIASAGFPSFSV